jgi:hypothetical protein
VGTSKDYHLFLKNVKRVVGGFLMEMIIDLRDPSMFAVSKDEVEKRTRIAKNGEARAEIAERLFLRILPFFFAQWADRGILKK